MRGMQSGVTARFLLLLLGMGLLILGLWSLGNMLETPAAEPVEVSEQYTVTVTPPDWERELIAAAMTGDADTGDRAGEALGYEYEDVRWLAKIMAAESGPEWPEWAVMAIGEVVLNRVEHEDFPNTIPAVLTQIDPIQYEPVHSGAWQEVIPTEAQVRMAMRLLRGERVLEDEDIVFQALFPQGDETVCTYYDGDLDTTTYFCAEREG